MTALVVLRERVIKPLLAASQASHCPCQAQPRHPTPVDLHYQQLRTAMRDLLTTLGIAA